jgi:hypothetical protein
MGLTCSLLGHRFGDPVVEQDREDRGQEAVTVTREVVVCERCGERRIRSESTEVAAVTDHSDGQGGPEGSADTDTGTEPASGEPATRADGDATGVEEAEPTTGAGGAPAAEPEPDPDPDLSPPETEPEDEGAEILTEESDSDSGERGFGEWPEEPDTTPDPGPESEPASEAPDADPADAGTEPNVNDTDADTDTDADADTGEFEEAAGADDGPVRLVCPDCGFSVAATGSPLRGGDACPDCSAAYLAERNE